MLNILMKDFRVFIGNDSLSKRIFKSIIFILFLTIVVGIEYFIFSTILDKIRNINNASQAFMSLFLAVISILIIVSDIFVADKLFFNEKDIRQLSSRPVSNSSIIVAKIIFLFLYHFFTTLLFTYPLFIAYGILYSKPLIYYYISLFYPVLSFLFETGLALILVYPFHYLIQFLHRHVITRYIVSITLLFSFTFIYSFILKLFINSLSESGINGLLTSDNINLIINMKKYLFNTSLLTNIIIDKKTIYLVYYLSISGGIFILGSSITIFFYDLFRNVKLSFNGKEKEYKYKVNSVNKTLIKKELLILTKNTSYTFSFIGILIVEPLLVYMVISALNIIFKTGIFQYYIMIVPNFLPIFNILVLMLFTVIINSGANLYLTSEMETMRLIKTMPVSEKKQLFIKYIIPFSLSLISFIVTLLVLLFTRLIDFTTFGFGFILVVLLLIIYDVISLIEELKIRYNKSRKYFLSNLYAYVVPISYFIITAIVSYFQISIYLVYLFGILTIILLSIYPVIYLMRNYSKMFLELDVN